MIEKELPINWCKTTLAEIGNVVTGNTPSKKQAQYYNGDIPWVKPGDINKAKIISTTEETLSEEGAQKARIIPEGSVMITCIGNLGNVAIAGKALATNQQINSIVINHNYVDKRYAYYWCLMLKPWLVENSTSTTISMVNKKNFENAPFLLPPLPEQKRIVAKLDALFGHLDVLREKLDRIPELLKNFRQQVLTQAVTGRLTEEWRKGKELGKWEGEPNPNMRDVNINLPTGWKWLSFDQVASIDSNLVQPNDYLNLPLIAPDNIQSETGTLLNIPLVSDILPKSPKHKFNSGHIVYSKIRPYLSKLVLVEFEGLCSADMYPISTELETKYLYYFMLSNQFLSYATTAGERSVLPKINQKGLSAIPVSVPSIDEQIEIVTRIASLFSAADKIEAQYQSLKEKIDQLPQAILAKAFKGELVSQDENDEPAEVLLERIKGGKTYTPQQEKLKLVAEEETKYHN